MRHEQLLRRGLAPGVFQCGDALRLRCFVQPHEYPSKVAVVFCEQLGLLIHRHHHRPENAIDHVVDAGSGTSGETRSDMNKSRERLVQKILNGRLTSH